MFLEFVAPSLSTEGHNSRCGQYNGIAGHYTTADAGCRSAGETCKQMTKPCEGGLWKQIGGDRHGGTDLWKQIGVQLEG